VRPALQAVLFVGERERSQDGAALGAGCTLKVLGLES
jgi:hypothetical protein